MNGIVHIRLELRSEGDAFAGRATSDEGSREFHGWMGLMGAIEALYPHSGTATVTAAVPAPRIAE